MLNRELRRYVTESERSQILNVTLNPPKNWRYSRRSKLSTDLFTRHNNIVQRNIFFLDTPFDQYHYQYELSINTILLINTVIVIRRF